MDILYDVAKTWYSNGKASEERKKDVLREFRAYFRKVSVQINISRLEDQVILTKLKYEIPADATELADLLGKHASLMDEDFVKVIEDYLDLMVKICQGLHVVGLGESPVYDQIDELDEMSKKGKDEIDKILRAI